MRRIIENSTIVFCHKNKKKKNKDGKIFIFNQTTKFGPPTSSISNLFQNIVIYWRRKRDDAHRMD